MDLWSWLSSILNVSFDFFLSSVNFWSPQVQVF